MFAVRGILYVCDEISLGKLVFKIHEYTVLDSVEFILVEQKSYTNSSSIKPSVLVVLLVLLKA